MFSHFNPLFSVRFHGLDPTGDAWIQLYGVLRTWVLQLNRGPSMVSS